MSQEFELDGESILNRDLLVKFLETRAAETEPAIPEPVRGHTFDSLNSQQKLIAERLIYMYCNGGYSAHIGNKADESWQEPHAEEVYPTLRQSVMRSQLNVS